MQKKRIVIVGGGSGGLYLASMLNPEIFKITIIEGQKTVGRKFLVAGKGGFNLSHSLAINKMIEKYHPSTFMEPFIRAFPASSLVEYLSGIGINTYIGSSGKVFPVTGIKPIEVLNAILEKMQAVGVEILTRTRWMRTLDNKITFMQNEVEDSMSYDYIVYALGGGSWSITGSDGAWMGAFQKMGIETLTLKASNCGILISWSEDFKSKWEGRPVKNITLSCGHHTVKGEIIITSYGMEGAPVYALNRFLRNQGSSMELIIDLIPVISLKKLSRFRKALNTSKSMGSILKSTLGLTPIKLALIKELVEKDLYQDRSRIEQGLKACKIIVNGFRPLDEAISTTGGIALSEINHDLMLNKLPGQYVIGEMLDWDAPTGGYLLQACYSMAAYLADHLNKKERHDESHRSA